MKDDFGYPLAGVEELKERIAELEATVAQQASTISALEAVIRRRAQHADQCFDDSDQRVCGITAALAAWPATAEPPETEPYDYTRYICTERGPRSKERCTRLTGHEGRHIGRSEGWYTLLAKVPKEKPAPVIEDTQSRGIPFRRS
jgi:hypothetical protein